MLTFYTLMTSLVAVAKGGPAAGHFAYGSQQEHCTTLYNTQVEQRCHEEFDQECHQECDDIVTHHCEQISTQVSHTSAIVGQESYLASEGKRYRKREAVPGYEYASKPQCQAKKKTQCHQTPVQTSHQVPRPVCVPVPRQVCLPFEVKIPYNTCGDSHVHVEQYTNDLVYGY